MISTWKGKLYVRKWPKKRGKPKSPATKFMNEWFRDAQQKMNYVDGRAMDFAISATKQTGLYPRDLMLRAASKGLFIIDDPERGLLYPRPLGVTSVAFQGASLYRTVNLAVTGGANVYIPWEGALLDSVGLWDPSVPSRLTIPQGVNVVNVTCTGVVGGTASQSWIVAAQRNHTTNEAVDKATGTTNPAGTAVTGPIPVSQGDYFEFFCRAGTTNVVPPDGLRMTLEILDASLPFNP